MFTTDPDTGVVNAGAYRMQVQNGGRAASVNMEAGKHGAAHVRAWFDRAGRAPVTASLGHDPLLLVVAGTEVPRGSPSWSTWARCWVDPWTSCAGEVTGLPVPAFSEIVVEGWLYSRTPRARKARSGMDRLLQRQHGTVLTMDIERIYHRDDPILLGAPPGKPPHDYSYMRSVMKSAMIHDALVATGLPAVEGVWAHEVGGGRQLLAVACTRVPGHVRQAGTSPRQLPSAAYMNKFVDRRRPDVDPRSLNDVMWAVCTRTDPADDIEVHPPDLGQPGRPAARPRARPRSTPGRSSTPAAPGRGWRSSPRSPRPAGS